MREIMARYPFTIDNIELVIIFGGDKTTSDGPYISAASIRRGFVQYKTNEFPFAFKYHLEEEESYDEALRAIEKNSDTPYPHNSNSISDLNNPKTN
jgi:hypothetical protein